MDWFERSRREDSRPARTPDGLAANSGRKNLGVSGIDRRDRAHQSLWSGAQDQQNRRKDPQSAERKLQYTTAEDPLRPTLLTLREHTERGALPVVKDDKQQN
jgi:hypothetical protein